MPRSLIISEAEKPRKLFQTCPPKRKKSVGERGSAKTHFLPFLFSPIPFPLSSSSSWDPSTNDSFFSLPQPKGKKRKGKGSVRWWKKEKEKLSTFSTPFFFSPLNEQPTTFPFPHHFPKLFPTFVGRGRIVHLFPSFAHTRAHKFPTFFSPKATAKGFGAQGEEKSMGGGQRFFSPREFPQ